MTAWLLLYLAASIRQDTALRSSCGEAGEVVRRLAAGTPVTLRFAMAGEDCYKISVAAGGAAVEGYVRRADLADLESFDRGRERAAWAGAEQILRAAAAAAPAAPPRGPAPPQLRTRSQSPAIAEASRLIQNAQPARALELLERELRSYPRDPGLLALAGIALWRADDPQGAVEAWERSLRYDPNPALEDLKRQVEREIAADQSRDRLVGLRVQLRYEGQAVPPETARDLLAILDAEYDRVSAELGCHGPERVVAIVQSPQAYRKGSDAAEWSGGMFDGRIRVPFPASGASLNSMRRVLAHETVHACLAMLGRWPAWLHEGLAQRLSGDTLPPAARAKLDLLAREGRLPRLGNLGQDWSRMSAEHAALAYALSLRAVELFFEHHAALGIRNLLGAPERLPALAADLDRRLGL